MTEVTETLEDIQAQLENKALAMGIDRYKDVLSIRGQAETQVGQRMMAAAIEPLTQAINEWRNPTTHIVRKRNSMVVLIDHLNSEALAVLTVRAVLQSIGKETTTTSLSRRVGMLVEEHSAWLSMMETDKGLAAKVGNQLKYTNHEGHRRAVTRHVTQTVAGLAAWPQKDTIGIGRVLIELMIESTNLIEAHHVYSPKRKRSTSYIRATESAVAFMEDGNARCELLAPVNGPMVCKPMPWTNTRDGGYITHRKLLVKTINQNYLSDLAKIEMPDLYRALNALQDTAYHVNPAVLDVMKACWAAGDTLAGIPEVNLRDRPARPANIDTDEQVLKEWKAAAQEVHAHNAEQVSKRLSFLRTVGLAEQFVHYDAIYFPHQLDWRGRAYPIPADLQPQGDDFAKGLLQLSEAVELGEQGAAWLKIHIANLFGVDKVSMADRIEWVESHHADIFDSAMDPMDGMRFWTTADKPWQALAACFDYAGYVIEGTTHKSRLIVATDGSCNGLQHLSALLLDEIGGKAVNLTPSDKPQDIYSQVKDAVMQILEDSSDDEASDWIGEGVSRKLVKRPVMTKPYGVTHTGMRDQLLGQMRKDGTFADADQKSRSHMAGYLAQNVESAIGGIVIASREVMAWLRGVATEAGKAGQPLHWVTPIGLPVLQDYREPASKRTMVYVGGRQLQYRIISATEKVATRKQAAGMSPNVVHSLDASHMMMSVNLCLDEGLSSFAMVHDSYGTHAAKINDLNILLRQAFVEMYREPVLQDLCDQFVSQVEQSVSEKFPELPPLGNLDIDEVLQSMYFFA